MLRWLLGALTLLLFTATAAQAQPFAQEQFSSFTFAPSSSSGAIYALDTLQLSPQGSAHVRVDINRRPLSVRTYCAQNTIDCDIEGEEIAAVRSSFALQLGGSVSLMRGLEISMGLPVVRVEGDGLQYSVGGSSYGFKGGDGGGLGDPQLRLTARFVEWPQLGVRLGGSFFLTAPLAKAMVDDRWAGEEGVTGGAHAIVEYEWAERVRAILNLGGVYRPERQLLFSEVGSMVTYAAGLHFDATSYVFMQGELMGRTRFDAERDQLEVRGLLGGRVYDFAVAAGAGLGLVRGPAVPTFRMLASVTWSPTADTDTDGDGVVDGEDGCPSVPEDLDGYGDDDGCPETDNDGDGVHDEADRCPVVPEDLDGFEDDDGCPDDDNDGDGVRDGYDSCPNTPEDRDSDRDDDGCPDDDRDRDNIPDDADACPDQAEDTDGVADTDGCPEEDADRDGIPDDEDMCPELREDRNGNRDDDGCPDAPRD